MSKVGGRKNILWRPNAAKGLMGQPYNDFQSAVFNIIIWRLVQPNNTFFRAAFSIILLRKIIENAALKKRLLPPSAAKAFFYSPKK
jgi:hypothetical protein